MNLKLVYPPVLTKEDFVIRYQKGEFGNASPSWKNLSSFLKSKPPQGLYHIRNRIAGGPTWYDVERDEVETIWNTLVVQGATPNLLYISAMCPTEKTLIQGEVIQSINHLDLTYSRVAKPMREALKESREYANGSKAVYLLRKYMDANSWEWLNVLLDRYPNHVVEFTTLRTCWGTLPNFNTVFWEVRNY